jgi:hypothetical protein
VERRPFDPRTPLTFCRDAGTGPVACAHGCAMHCFRRRGCARPAHSTR